MQNVERTTGYYLSKRRNQALPNDAALLRLLITHAAQFEVCVATYHQNASTIYVDTRHPIPLKEIKRIRHKVHQTAQELGWAVSAAASDLELCINGILAKYVRHTRQNHRLSNCSCFGVNLFHQEPLIVCVCGVDSEIDEEFMMELHALSTAPEVGFRALLAKVLRKTEDLSNILLSMIDGVILCDEKVRIRFMNEKARKLCGFEQVPQLGSPLEPTPLCDLTQLLYEAMEDGITQLNRVIPLGNSNSQLLGVNIQFVKNFMGQPVGWLLILRDITASWQSDQIRSMISIASHELNTPLASMKNTLDLLLDREVGELTPNQEKFLRIIQDDMTRLQRLLHDLLDLSRLEDGRMELDRRRHVRIEFVANKVIESFRVFAESRGITLRTDIPSGISGINGDRDRITQILVNLVDNAIKYSHFGGEVIIAARETEDEVIVSVSDQGVGISQEDLNFIFERFVQLDNLPEGVHRGFGLGLSIAKDIVQSHHGRMWAESEPGKGSTFYFSLPKIASDASKADPATDDRAESAA
ncbi:MAG: ATP-binding protein [candidate division KSB1 bacterium]|nr:ATP-binding protein [candidate division KSB1 bacterium]